MSRVSQHSFQVSGPRKSRGVVLSCRGGGYVRINPNKRKMKKKQSLENREIYFTEDRFIAGEGQKIMLFQPGVYLVFSECWLSFHKQISVSDMCSPNFSWGHWRRFYTKNNQIYILVCNVVLFQEPTRLSSVSSFLLRFPIRYIQFTVTSDMLYTAGTY